MDAIEVCMAVISIGVSGSIPEKGDLSGGVTSARGTTRHSMVRRKAARRVIARRGNPLTAAAALPGKIAERTAAGRAFALAHLEMHVEFCRWPGS